MQTRSAGDAPTKEAEVPLVAGEIEREKEGGSDGGRKGQKWEIEKIEARTRQDEI